MNLVGIILRFRFFKEAQEIRVKRSAAKDQVESTKLAAQVTESRIA